MKAFTKLTLDIPVEIPRYIFGGRIRFFSKTIYAQAVFEGVMNVGRLENGNTFKVFIFNDEHPTEFRIRNIDVLSQPNEGVRHSIELYERLSPLTLRENPDGSESIVSETPEGSIRRIEQGIAPRLAAIGLHLTKKAEYKHIPAYRFIPRSLNTPDYLSISPT